jgi:type IV pilus assembly protein PilZ
VSSVPPKSQQPASERPASDRRSADRIDVTWSVDCETEDTFLYANITNISEVGIFVRTNEPLEVGTRLTLKFAPPGTEDTLVLTGQVAWVNPIRMLASNPNPGMGIRFIDLTQESRERLVGAVRTIAYVRSSSN